MTVPPGTAFGLGLEEFGKGDMDGHGTSLYHIDPYCSHEFWNWIDYRALGIVMANPKCSPEALQNVARNMQQLLAGGFEDYISI